MELPSARAGPLNFFGFASQLNSLNEYLETSQRTKVIYRIKMQVCLDSPSEAETIDSKRNSSSLNNEYVRHFIPAGIVWEVAERLGLIEHGPSEPRLWSPSPALESCIDEVEANLRQCGLPRVAIDLGCSQGRDVVFLASRGWRVIGIDNQPKLLAKLSAFSVRAQVESLIEAKCLDVGPKSRPDALDEVIPSVSFVNICRFMPPTFLLLRIRELMFPGSWVCICHFAPDAISNGANRTLQTALSLSDLVNIFEDWTIHVSQETDIAPSDHRPCILFVAEKKRTGNLSDLLR